MRDRLDFKRLRTIIGLAVKSPSEKNTDSREDQRQRRWFRHGWNFLSPHQQVTETAANHIGVREECVSIRQDKNFAIETRCKVDAQQLAWQVRARQGSGEADTGGYVNAIQHRTGHNRMVGVSFKEVHYYFRA